MTQNISYNSVYKIFLKFRLGIGAAARQPQWSPPCHKVRAPTMLLPFARISRDCKWCTPLHATQTLPKCSSLSKFHIRFHGTQTNKSIYAHKAVRYSVCQLLRTSPVLNRVLCRFLLPNFIKIAYQMWNVRIKEQLCP